MSVPAASTTAMIWLYVPILWGPSPAHVTIRTKGMEDLATLRARQVSASGLLNLNFVSYFFV